MVFAVSNRESDPAVNVPHKVKAANHAPARATVREFIWAFILLFILTKFDRVLECLVVWQIKL